MVSESTHRLFVKILKFGQYLGIIRFYWHDKKCQLIYRKHGFHVWRESIHSFVLMLYTLFVVLRGFQIVVSENVGTKQKIVMAYSMIIFVVLAFYQFLCIFRGPELCALVNGLMVYTNRTPGMLAHENWLKEV